MSETVEVLVTEREALFIKGRCRPGARTGPRRQARPQSPNAGRLMTTSR